MPAFAEDLALHSGTYLHMRETVFDESVFTLYEFLDLNVEDILGKDVSLYSGGWFRADFGEETTDGRTDGELGYAHLRFGSYSRGLVDAGRVYVFEGVASEQIDGLYGRTDIWKGFGLSVFGGSPVEGDFDGRGGDLLYGARLYQEKPGLYSIGVSYLKEENGGDDFREESGVDLWLRPVDTVMLQGISSYNSVTGGWMEHTYSLSLGPFRKLLLNAEFSDINYEHFFSSATLSAFDIFRLDTEESVRIIGGNAEYPITDTVSVSVLYKNFDYDVSGSADYYGGALRYFAGEWAAGASLHRMDGESNKLRYYEYRAYVSKKLGDADLTLDFLDVSYDEAINGVGNAYSLSLAAGYSLAPQASLGADVEYAKNPFFDEEVRALFKFLYSLEKKV